MHTPVLNSGKALAFIFVALALTGMVMAIGGVLKVVLISAMFVYLSNPLVTRLEARGMGRLPATLLFLLVMGVCVGSIVGLLYPMLAIQFKTLQHGVTSEKAMDLIVSAEGFIRRELGFLGFEDFDVATKLQEILLGFVNRTVDFLLTDFLSIVLQLVIIPFIVFFLLKDGREIRKEFIGIIPNRYFEFSLDLLHKMNEQLGNFLRSQFLDGLIMGALATLMLWLLGVKYFLFIGLFAGLANLIPYFGPVAGALLAAGVSLVDTGDIMNAVYVVCGFAVLKLFDDIVIQPAVVARGVDLHPLIVLLVIIIGGHLFGILGMLLAVPVTGFIKVVMQESLTTYRKYRFA